MNYSKEEQEKTIDYWFSTMENKDKCMEAVDADSTYFVKRILSERDKEKAISALCFLSTSKKGINKKIFFDSFNKIVIGIDDLVLFLESTKKVRGFGKVIRKSVYNWFKVKDKFKIDRLLSYNIGNTAWTNRDILNKFHIKPWNKQVSLIFKKYVEREKEQV